MSFADICAAQFSATAETHTAAPAPGMPSNSPAQSGNPVVPANPAPAKSSAKNAPGSNPLLVSLLGALTILPAIRLDSLVSLPAQPVQSLASDHTGDECGSASAGTNQATNFAPASGTATVASLTPASVNAPTFAALIPSLAPAADSLQEVPASAPTQAQDPWALSSPIQTNEASSNPWPGSPSTLPHGIGAESSTLEETPAAAPDDPESSNIVSAARESFGMDADVSFQAPVTVTVSEILSSGPDVQPPLTPGDLVQASPKRVPAEQASPAAVEMSSSQDAPPQNMIQVAANLSSQIEQPAPGDQKSPQPCVLQPRSPLGQETSRASAVPGTGVPKTIAASSAATATTSLASHTAVPGIGAATSAVPLPAHASSKSDPMSSAAPDTQHLPTAENNFAVPTKNDPASRQLGHAPACAAGSQGSASSPASAPPVSSSESSSAKKDSGGNANSEQPKGSPNVGVAAAGTFPIASPAFTNAPPSAQVSVSQASSLPDAGTKSNSQTSAGVPDNAPRSSFPATADAPTPASASPLQWAQMANKANQAEMRIGLNTMEFGSVEVRTSVHSSDVGVQIGSEKGDLRSLLTPEFPSIANTLQQHDLRLAQVSFHQQGFAFAGNSSFSGGNSQPRSFASRPEPSGAFSEESSLVEPPHAFEPVVSPRGTGLSILA
jgi:hypothetical protein